MTPAYPESGLDAPVLAPVREAITHILDGHLPYPALVADRHGDLIAANEAMEVITEGPAPELVGPGTNIWRTPLAGEQRRVRPERLGPQQGAGVRIGVADGAQPVR